MSQFLRAACSPKVKVGVVGAGTARVFDEPVLAAQGALHVAFTPSKGPHDFIFIPSLFYSIHLSAICVISSNIILYASLA